MGPRARTGKLTLRQICYDSHRINQLRGSSVHAACLTEEFMVGLGQFKTFCPPQLQSLSEGSGGLLLSLVLASVLSKHNTSIQSRL